LWPSLAALGCALGRAGRVAEAVEPLRAAVAANPFDCDAARALSHALRETGRSDELQELIEQRRDLAASVPLLRQEEWFAVAAAPPEPDAASNESGWLQTISQEDFLARFPAGDCHRAVCGFTNATDTRIVLALLADARPKRILEIGTALGQMTANLTEWSSDDAVVFTLGAVADLPIAVAGPQRYETPSRQDFGRLANAFGKVAKVLFITADSLGYDFRRLEWIDFAFIDGGHDLQHVLADSSNVYEILRPGGLMVWHDFTSPAAWVEVRRALERLRFAEPIVHVAGTTVAFLRKAEAGNEPVALRTAPVVPEKVALSADAWGDVEGMAQSTPAEAEELAPVAAASGRSRKQGDLSIVWEGAQQAVHSFAVVNRAMCSHLLQRGHALSVLPSPHPQFAERAPDGSPPPARYRVIEPEVAIASGALAESFYRRLPSPAIHVRHQWPPCFTPPAAGHWVIVQPWEYGSLPKSWVAPMSNLVDEVWAYTHYVRDCYLAAGVPADRVHVVPVGVDCRRFHPQAPRLALPTSKRFKFLFVGGTLHRKGIDVLLAAFSQAFTSQDDVCLVIKDMGTGTFYQGQTAGPLIGHYQQQPGAAEILYLDRSLSEEQLAGLYAACDCLVHPYRGEGFGLPIAEAMACGLPVVVTAGGAADDFCNEENAWLIPSQRAYFPQQRAGDLETVARPWLLAPDGAALTRILRHVFSHQEEARAKGGRGCQRIREHFTWEHAALIAERRMRRLRQQPIRRRQPLPEAERVGPPSRGGPEVGPSSRAALPPGPARLAGPTVGPPSRGGPEVGPSSRAALPPGPARLAGPTATGCGGGVETSAAGAALAARGLISAVAEPARGAGSSGEKGPLASRPAATADQPQGGRPKVSLCLIVKNEEANLPDCLDSAAGLVDEIIVVDTGSTDCTKEIARYRGAKVFDFPWIDSFAQARNESLKHASGEWIFWLDADDRLDAVNRVRLKTLFDALPEGNVAFVMKCLCLPDPQSNSSTLVDHVRLFRNQSELRWEFRVHEQILPALRRAGHRVSWSDVVIRHTGYQDPELRQRKLQRDLRLLHLEDSERPNHPFTLFNLGSIAQELGRPHEAIPLLQRSLELSAPTDSITRKLYALLAQCHRHVGQPHQALQKCVQGRRLFPDDVELLFQEGVLLREMGQRSAARDRWSSLLQPRPAQHFASIDVGLVGYKTLHNLAVLELEEGNLVAAECHWRRALAEKPDFAPAVAGLHEVRLRQQQQERKESA
jgi:glycosyltransferase involved in cell wall biosynthesis/predicted O-methyltransferase YrrM